jgi:hypothetical protein
MKEKTKSGLFKNKLLSIHFKIVKIFSSLLIEAVLPIFAAIFGVVSWIFPVVKLWTDIIDGELNLLNSISYIFIGVILFYTSFALHDLYEKTREKDEREEKIEDLKKFADENKMESL